MSLPGYISISTDRQTDRQAELLWGLMRTTPQKHNVDLQLKERSSFCSFYKLCWTFRLGL